MAPQTHLHTDLLGLLRQHSRCRDQRHLVLLAWMVLGLLLRGKLAAACSALAQQLPH